MPLMIPHWGNLYSSSSIYSAKKKISDLHQIPPSTASQLLWSTQSVYFSPHTHNVTCCSLGSHVTVRRACVTDTQYTNPKLWQRLHVTVVKCLIASLTHAISVVTVYCLFAKFGRPSRSADLKSISLALPCAKTHSFFFFHTADDPKLLKLIIK